MWKNVNGRLVQLTDDSRIKFRTNISQNILNQLKEMAEEHDTHINYLLETGLEYAIQQPTIAYNKKLRPKDRVQYKTTYDKDLLRKAKDYAKSHDIFLNDLIEYSVQYIDVQKAKSGDYKNRIE